MSEDPVPDGEKAPPAAPDAGDRDVCIILNAGSGNRSANEVAREIKAGLEAHPGRVSVRRVSKGSELLPTVEQAAGEDFPVVVAAGGDGTIGAVAMGIAGSGKMLGVLPLGTFNYFARGLGLPEALPEALRVLGEGRAAPLQVGEVNGRIFLNNASLGLYPAILRRREHVYRRWGRSRIAAYWSVLLSLLSFRSPLRLKVTIDGEVRRLKTPLVFVANNAYQLELFDLGGADCVRSGQFAVLVAPDRGRLGLVVYAIRLALGQMEAKRDFELLCGRDILVEDRMKRRLVARDGERELMTGPFRFRMREDALRVILPRGTA